ncbi:MAG: ribonuclease P protein component [Streptococcaceae bacterium]|nr:ribonuclease P protein component [Streptococcaceae bacterium]
MGIKKSFRIKKSSDFDALFKAKKSFANRAFILYQKESNLPHYRVGLSVSKKLGNAVTRNRIKRLIRAALKDFSSCLVAADFIIIARKGVEDYDFAAVKKNLSHLLRKSNIIRNEHEEETHKN